MIDVDECVCNCRGGANNHPPYPEPPWRVSRKQDAYLPYKQIAQDTAEMREAGKGAEESFPKPRALKNNPPDESVHEIRDA